MGALTQQIYASVVNFLQAGAGAIWRTVQAKLRDYPRSNTEFASLQAVTDSYGNTAANSAGGVYIPIGTYNQGSTVQINGQTGYKFEGAGKFLTIIQATAAAAGLPLFLFVRGAYCSVKEMSINALAAGPQIDSAIQCIMSAAAGPTPQGMIFENLYINAQQNGGFSCGIRFNCTLGQDNNNERGFFKNVDCNQCGTGISFENYNSLVHQIYGGVIGACGVGISTANGLGGSFSATGVTFISNTVADIDIGDNSTHSTDIVNCKSEAGTGLWIRCLQTGTITHGAITGGPFTNGETVTQAVSGATGVFIKETAGVMTLGQCTGTFNNVNIMTGGASGANTPSTGLLAVARQDINVQNSTWHGTVNNASVDYRGSGKFVMENCQLQQTGAARTIQATDPASVLVLKHNFFDIDTVSYAGTLVWGGNKYTGGMPTLNPTATTSRLINLDESDYAPVTETNAARTVGVTDAQIICNRAGTITLTLPDATKWTGRQIIVRTIQAQTVVSNANNVIPLAGGGAGTAILAATAGKWAQLKSDGTNWQIMAGN